MNRSSWEQAHLSPPPGVTATFSPALSALADPTRPALRPLVGVAPLCTQDSFLWLCLVGVSLGTAASGS